MRLQNFIAVLYQINRPFTGYPYHCRMSSGTKKWSFKNVNILGESCGRVYSLESCVWSSNIFGEIIDDFHRLSLANFFFIFNQFKCYDFYTVTLHIANLNNIKGMIKTINFQKSNIGNITHLTRIKINRAIYI